jgi:hypothetical protein
VRPGGLDHRPRDDHLAARRPSRHAVGLVDLAAVVVAVAVQRLAEVHADARQRALDHDLLEADRPVDERRRVAAHDHDLVADRLHHASVLGQRVLNDLHEALDRADGLLLAHLLGQPRVAGQVGEGDPDTQAAEVRRLVAELGLHVADHVLLDEVRQEALVDVVHDRRRQGQQLAGDPAHLLRHLQRGHAVPHERLVHVEVEEAHLRVGHLRDRLPVHARDLEHGHEREAGLEHRGDVAQELRVLLGDVLKRRGAEAHRRVQPLDERLLEPGLLGRLLERVVRPRGRQELLHVPEREAALVRGPADLLEGVAAVAQARDDARVGDRGVVPVAVAGLRDHPRLGPAAQRAGLHARAARGLGERHACAHGPGAQNVSGGIPMSVIPPPAGLTSRCVGRRRSSAKRRRLAGGPSRSGGPPTLRPGACVVDIGVPAAGDGCQRQRLRVKPSGAGTRARRRRGTGRRSAS